MSETAAMIDPPAEVTAATQTKPAPAAWRSRWVRPAWGVAERDLIRFLRQPTRIVSAILTPLLFWAMLGFGVGSSFQPGGAGEEGGVGYATFLLPGASLLLVMFTAVFATIGVIEDRREGFLQSIEVSPAARGAVVAGKLAAATLLAVAQAAVLLAIGWAATGTLAWWGQALGAAVTLTLASVAFGGVGLAAAWVMRSTASYHAGMMVVLMPAWAISGAVFPFSTAPPAMQALMLCNPVTYLNSLHAAAVLGPEAAGLGVTLWVAGPVAVLVTAGSVALAWRAVSRRGG
ncbi:MAG: ABC transporter permease [Planctomycetota bacterium]